MSVALADQPFKRPGTSRGLIEVVKQPYLTSLIVHKELRQRYRGSIFGMIWSYVKPATQFIVFYVAMGMFMGMNKNIDNYVIYLFSGIVAVNYFSEAFGNSTRSIVGNAPLVKKIYLPRELFPVSSLWVAFVHFLPQAVILIIGCFVVGWHPTWLQIGAILLGFIIISVFALGLGLIFGAINVFYRDAENFVDLIMMVVTWVSPVFYQWQMVRDVLLPPLHGIGWYLYQANPIAVVVELFHYGFWDSTVPAEISAASMLPRLAQWSAISLVIAVIVLAIGEFVFRRLDPKFAQEL